MASNIHNAYEALSIYDYFKAKKLFYKSLKKVPSDASFGLATIFARTDNPFSNTDSAAKYISISKLNFKDTITYFKYHISAKAISKLEEEISLKGFKKYNDQHTILAYNAFLNQYNFASDDLKKECYNLRDSIAYDYFSIYKSSDSIVSFLLKYPQTYLYNKAKYYFYNLQYHEKAPSLTEKQLKLFIRNYPNNPYIFKAESVLFDLIKQMNDADSLYQFIGKYSSLNTREEAWKSLYSLSVKNYTKEELFGFIQKYPDYPYNQNLLKEIYLSNRLLIPMKNNDEKYGYIDTLGAWVIKPQFDDADLFSEGFSAVCKNDSCFYINKDGQKTSDFYFEETENYVNGIAIVKKESKYYLINRSGQFVSNGYEDISEPSNNLFVCKSKNNYGAINFKGEVIIPFSYSKLGNFKNGYAYYLTSHYGLVNTNNFTLKAQWDWISDVDTNKIVIVKKENKFGLMRINEEIILPPSFDYIAPCQNGIYLLVKNGLYGFYNVKELCYITSISYTYNSAYETSDYTNGIFFKLLLDDEVALVDANGRFSINFGVYNNLFFAKCAIIRIQKNNKFGYLDRKLKAISTNDFDQATDFENNFAIVSKGLKSQIINKEGQVTYISKEGKISKLDDKLFLITTNELIGVIDYTGEIILPTNFKTIEKIKANLYKCTKVDGNLFLFNSNTKSIVKL